MYLPRIAPDLIHKPGLPKSLRGALHRHRLLAGIVLGYGSVSLGLSIGVAGDLVSKGLSAFSASFAEMVPIMIYCLLFWRLLIMRLTVPRTEQKGWLKADLRRSMADPERLASALVGMALMLVVLLSFAQLKRLIPIIQPFAWDPTLMALDQSIHFGMGPWRIVHALAGNPLVITGITGAYNFWMFLMYFSLIFACFSMTRQAERMQYLIAFILTWAIGGNLVATIFSSAGPVYVERLGLGDHFAPLMSILREHATRQPLTVTEVQDLLWSFYAAPESVSGISAFPSMHVASTTLMALYARAYDRRLGRVMAVFAGVIMLGSVLLAWHYAIDGYAGAAIALASWWVAGRLVRRLAVGGPGRP